jgi:hypothetical protein
MCVFGGFEEIQKGMKRAMRDEGLTLPQKGNGGKMRLRDVYHAFPGFSLTQRRLEDVSRRRTAWGKSR